MNSLAILPIQILLWVTVGISLNEFEFGILPIIFILYIVFASLIGIKELILGFKK